jgi:Ca2+-binding EF-hand superfamily protein
MNYFDADELTDDECLMVMRFFDTDGEGRIDYTEFAAKIVGKDIGVTNYQSAASDDMGDTIGEESIDIDEEEMKRYMSIAREAQEAEQKKYVVANALKEFQTKTEAMSKDVILNEFRLYDKMFDNTISLSDFKTILTHTLNLANTKADAVVEEIKRRFGVADVLTFAQFLSSLKLQ